MADVTSDMEFEAGEIKKNSEYIGMLLSNRHNNLKAKGLFLKPV